MLVICRRLQSLMGRLTFDSYHTASPIERTSSRRVICDRRFANHHPYRPKFNRNPIRVKCIRTDMRLVCRNIQSPTVLCCSTAMCCTAPWTISHLYILQNTIILTWQMETKNFHRVRHSKIRFIDISVVVFHWLCTFAIFSGFCFWILCVFLKELFWKCGGLVVKSLISNNLRYLEKFYKYSYRKNDSER